MDDLKSDASKSNAVKFIAMDTEDLEVVSAHLQDALITVADILYRPQEKRLVLALNRFDWPSADGGAQFRRCRAALRFERVTGLKCKNIDPAAKDRVLNLLAVDFEPKDSPAGCVQLLFSEGVTLRVDVECLEAELADLGPSWPVASRPTHEEMGAEAG